MVGKNIKNALLILSVIVFAAGKAFSADFADVGKDYWAYDAISGLSEKNIVSGYQDNTFRPDDFVTRAEFATMAVKALEKTDTSTNISAGFIDVPANFWAAKNIKTAYKLGLINGFPDGRFAPQANVTKIQVISVLSNAVKDSSLTKDEAVKITSRFTDALQVPSWGVISLANVYRKDILVNYPLPNKVEPNKNATRAEVAAMLYNLRSVLNLTVGVSSTSTTSTTSTPAVTPYYDEITVSSQNNAYSEVYVNGNAATILVDTTFPAELRTALNSTLNKVGDKVSLRINQNITTSKGLNLILRSSRIEGTIDSIVRASQNTNNAVISINFNSIITPTGEKYPITAAVATQTGDIISGSLHNIGQKGIVTTAKDAATGAIVGSLLGSLTGGAKTGAIYGGTTASGLGKLGAILYSGGEIDIPVGEIVFIKLTNPLTIDTTNQKVIIK